MGVSVSNKELVYDYTTNKQYFRIHLDLPLTPDQADALRGLLKRGDMEAVKETLLRIADPRGHSVIRALE